MSLLKRIKSLAGIEKRDVFDPYWSDFFTKRTGTVTVDNAQSVAACYAAVSVIAEAIGSLPLHLYKREDGDERSRADSHPLYAVLHHAPNEYQSSQEFIEWLTASMLLHGNGYARITRGHDGQVRSLFPLAPERVNIKRQGDVIAGYEYINLNGHSERLLPDEVFHVRHRAGSDPLVGLSPIAAARGVFQLALSEQEHGQNTFTNGTRLSGTLNVPGQLKQEQRQALKDSWQAQYAGAGNAGKVPVLEAGTTFSPMSMSLEDAEWIAARQFSVQEVARVYKVPPVLIGDLTHANFSNSVEMNRWFVTHTLQRHMSAWEGAISRQLLSSAGRRIYFAEFAAEGLLRGDAANRANFYEKAINSGWMTIAEVRKLENLPAIKSDRFKPMEPPK